MNCEICSATPAFGTAPDIILCDICRGFFTGQVSEVKHVTIQQPVAADHKAMMARIDASRPSWHRTVYGGGK